MGQGGFYFVQLSLKRERGFRGSSRKGGVFQQRTKRSSKEAVSEMRLKGKCRGRGVLV